MKETGLHIIIIAEATPRAKTIRKLLTESFEKITLDIISSNDLDSELNSDNQQVSLLCLVDLMSSEESSFTLIGRIKEQLPPAKIIAMHIYRSDFLIEPLYKQGIHGYLFSEPSRNELLEAVNTVIKGKNYRPSFLRSP